VGGHQDLRTVLQPGIVATESHRNVRGIEGLGPTGIELGTRLASIVGGVLQSKPTTAESVAESIAALIRMPDPPLFQLVATTRRR
jgi:hypothetical protein